MLYWTGDTAAALRELQTVVDAGGSATHARLHLWKAQWHPRVSALACDQKGGPVIEMSPIGYVRTPYGNTKEIPKGLGAKHDAEGTLEILPDLAPGLADIEGFSHLFV